MRRCEKEMNFFFLGELTLTFLAGITRNTQEKLGIALPVHPPRAACVNTACQRECAFRCAMRTKSQTKPVTAVKSIAAKSSGLINLPPESQSALHKRRQQAGLQPR